MKPRIVRAHQILAIALSTGAAACAPGVGATSGGAAGPPTAAPELVVASPEPPPQATPGLAETASPVAAVALAETVVDVAAAGAALAGSVPVADSPPQPAPAEDPRLVALREELLLESGGGPSRVARFRPLCDDDGYPLVGNVVRGKSGPAQPSAFCANVRGPAVR